MTETVHITIDRAELDAHRLQVKYTILNETDATVFVYTAVPDFSSQEKQLADRIARDRPQLFLEAPATLRLQLGITPTPSRPGLSLYAPRRPYAEKMAAGESWSREAVITVPVVTWDLYRYKKDNRSGIDAVGASELKLAVDWLREADASTCSLIERRSSVLGVFRRKEPTGFYQVNGHPIVRSEALYELRESLSVIPQPSTS